VGGGPGSFLVFYLGSFSLDDAWNKTVSVSVLSFSPVLRQVPAAQGVVEVTLSTLALFVDLYLTRYLRRKVLAADPKLSPLSPGGEITYHRVLGLVTNPSGSLFFTFVFFVVYFPARALIAGNPLSLFGMVILTPVANLVYGTAFWVYLSALFGVYKFGLEPLNLKPFYEDRMLGLRPLGQIVVSSAMVFSGAITITLGASLVTGDVGSILINLVIVAFGVAMLFVPLGGIHRKMVEVKENEEARLSSRNKDLLMPSENRGSGNQQSLAKIEDLVELHRFQALRAEASRISTWPFETRSVERLVGILLAIFTVLLARLLALTLH
jgi:hypothetical protein